MIGIYPQTDGSVFVDGAVAVRDLNNAMAWTLPVENTKTIAGLILCETAAIPEQGQAFVFHGYRFEVACKSDNRIAALKVTPLDTKSASRISMHRGPDTYVEKLFRSTPTECGANGCKSRGTSMRRTRRPGSFTGGAMVGVLC